MPSGPAIGEADQKPDAAEVEAGLAAQGGDLGRAGAMLPGRTTAALAAGRRARPGAEAAMQAATAVAHGRLPAGAARPGLGSATRRGQEIAGGIAVVEAAATVGREDGGGRWIGHGFGSGRPVGWGCNEFVKCSSIRTNHRVVKMFCLSTL